MKLTLYTSTGEELFDIIPASSSGQDWSLMSDNKLSVTFDLETCVLLLPGCYVDFEGSRFYLLEEYKPTMINTSLWRYNVSFKDAASWMAITIALNLIDGQNKPIFNYTAPAAEHAAIIVANLNRRMNTTAWKVGSVIDTPNITIEYAGKYCSEILQEIVDGQKTEWWIDDMTLNIGRAEFGDIIELGYQQGLLGDIVCQKADDMRSYAYLYPVGSTRNIDPTKYGYDRLQLPDGQTRVDMNVEQGVAELVEEAAFSGIYPRYVGKVTEVSTSVGTSDGGSQYVIYFIQDDQIPFNPNDYELPGEVKHVTFQSGELMGADFEVNYNNERREFEIITQWSKDGAQLPGGTLVPAVGDEYVVWNITMPDEYYPLASQEFLEAAEAFAKAAIQDASVYKAPMDYIYVQEKGLRLRPGQRVRLVSDKYFSKGYYDSRVTRITRNLSNPNALNIDVSAVRVIGTIQQLQNAVKSSATQVTQISNTVQTVVRTVDNAVTLTGNQRVQGVKNFVDGIRLNGSPIIEYHPAINTWLFRGNILAEGGMAAFSNIKGFTPSTITDAVLIDNRTIKRGADGLLYVDFDEGGSGGGSLDEEQLEEYLKPYAKTADVANTYATKSSVNALNTQLNDFLSGSDTDTIINKWSELEKFLAGLAETDDLATILSGKANKATTLAGYGITDAYTKSHIDGNFVTIGTKQEITGEKDFVGGFKVNGGLVEYNATLKTWVFNGDLLVTGGMSAFSNISGFKPSTITEAVLIDNKTIKLNADGLLYAVAQETDGINEEQLADYLTANGYATQDWVTDRGYITSSGNAASATKLKNSVSLWGRTFDGSADLTGALTVTTGEGYRINYNGYDLRFIVSGSSSNRGIWDNTNNNWLMYRSGSNDIYFTSGNIGFGTTSPTEKVTVSGNVKSTGHFNSTSANSHYLVNGKEVIGSYLNTYFLFDSAPTDGYDTHILGSQIYLKGGAAKTLAMLITSSGNVDVKGKLTLPTGSSNFTNASLWFGNSVRIGANSSNALGLYADYAIRLSPDSLNSANTTKGLWLLKSGYNGVNNSSPTEALDVTGNIKASGTLIGANASISNVLNLTATPSQVFDGAQILFAGGNGRIGASASGFMGLYANTFTFRPSSTTSASSIGFTIDANANIATTGNIKASGVLKLPAVDSGFTNPRITFGDNSVIRIGATTSGLLGVYASGDIRLNPNSASSANGTMGLWLKTTGYNGINTSNPAAALHVNGKGIFADATNPWISLQRDGVNWYLQVVSTGLKLGRTSALGVLVDDSGNMVAPGGVTATNSSDERLKRNIRKFNAREVLISLGGVWEYEYIDSEVQKNHIYEGTHFGLIYQHVKGTKLDVMCHEREDGMGALNYLHPKFISLIAGATMENISEVEKLKRKIRHLENTVKQLESRA